MTDDPRRIVLRALREAFPADGQGLSLNGNGLVRLDFEGSREITLQVPEHGPTLFAQGRLLILPAGDHAPFLRKALAVNLFQLGLAGAWIALDVDTSALVLCTARPVAGLDGEALGAFLLPMIETMASLGRKLQPEAAAVEAPAESLDDLFILRL